jgi:hypothetical protein
MSGGAAKRTYSNTDPEQPLNQSLLLAFSTDIVAFVRLFVPGAPPLSQKGEIEMRRQLIASFLIVSAMALVVSMTLVAQDRFSLKAANGIAFSEFKGYDEWQVIATSQPDDASGCGTSKDGCMKAILGNPAMIKAYHEGIPANGKPVPDGAAMAKIEWAKVRNRVSPYGVTVPGAQRAVSFMVKDSKRFADTNGWGYARFQRTIPPEGLKPSTSDPAFGRALCHECHTRGAKPRDFVYTEYALR